MSADFFSIAIPLDAEDAAARVPALAAAEEEYNGNVYVDATEDVLGWLAEDTPMSMSPNFPAFVALDRFAAGGRLLGGHAFRWVPADQLVALGELVEELGACGEPAAEMLDRGGNGDEDLRTSLDALATGVELAARRACGLLLVCVPC